MLTFSILLSVTFMVILLGGWSGNGLIATLGAILASFSLALRVASLLRPDLFPVSPYPRPPTLPPSPPTGSSPPAREKVEACTLQHARDDDIRWLENLSDQVRELRMAVLPAEGETAEVLWDMLRDRSMTEQEILTALRDLQQETRDTFIALRRNEDSLRTESQTSTRSTPAAVLKSWCRLDSKANYQLFSPTSDVAAG
ncbi:hypothetical protein FAVG1_10061 [Fusarium avenaceum]|nr:hypothetical protein FAVG1_10061 [Fusarium avenaceum]